MIAARVDTTVKAESLWNRIKDTMLEDHARSFERHIITKAVCFINFPFGERESIESIHFVFRPSDSELKVTTPYLNDSSSEESEWFFIFLLVSPL